MVFIPGRVVQWREVLHGQVWSEYPVTVVDDRGAVLAVLLEPGSAFVFPEHPFGVHPWARHRGWTGPTVLQLRRDGDPYSVWKSFSDGVFTHWYLNVEAPIVRRPDGAGGGGFDTDDHGIDIVVPADGSPWRWKDVDDPEAMAAAGRITTAEAQQIHADADALAELLRADDRWWHPWDTWQPGDPPPSQPAGATPQQAARELPSGDGRASGAAARRAPAGDHRER